MTRQPVQRSVLGVVTCTEVFLQRLLRTRQLSLVCALAAGDFVFAQNARGQTTAAEEPQPLVTRHGLKNFARMTGDMLSHELIPSFNGTYKNAPFQANRWGMRDKDYELRPAPGTYRIAFLGSSFSMAGGVPVEQAHEWLLEERLNREGPGAPRREYEILNFSVAGYGVMHQVVTAEKKVFRFTPNSVLVVIHSIEPSRMIDYLISAIRAKIPIEYPYVRQKLQEAGVQPDMEEPELRRRLSPVSLDLVRWSFQRLVHVCREHGVPVAAIAFFEPRRSQRDAQLRMLAGVASGAGIQVLSLEGTFDGHPAASVSLKRDAHLNALGHQLVADRLFQLLRENDARTLKLGFGNKATDVTDPRPPAARPTAARPEPAMPRAHPKMRPSTRPRSLPDGRVRPLS